MASEPSAPAAQESGSVLPVVARPRAGLSTIAIIGFAAIGFVLLFAVLNARRQAAMAPSTASRMADSGRPSAAVPQLVIPPEPAPPVPMPAPTVIVAPAPAAPDRPPTPQPAPRTYVPLAPPPQYQPAPAPIPPRAANGASLVIDNSEGARPPGATPVPVGIQPQQVRNDTDRARAGMFANRATTVVQGTLIPAVLETGFDSNRAGFARAIVSRNVIGFDGTRVLIPRGSRLIGEYRSDAGPGQNRALINWTRLIRPDGATINIGSPAADRVGRTGIRADVDTHFFERFSGAILQSVLDFGVNLALRNSNAPVIVPLPNNNGSAIQSRFNQVPRTLSVKPGTSISVFVARDLDFTEVEGGK
ncbi:MAG TPA: TrbI/VirB10 family protein [Sphingomonas sp.]|nr:TrbI/VirB10 family protein [Sphingomonas sp.]